MEVLFGRCVCGKVMTREELKMEHSGVGGVTYTSMLCPSCISTYKEAARIICRSCLRLQGFMSPVKYADGFEFKPNQHYHINGCPQCRPGIFKTAILEHEAWLKARRLAVKTELDLVQEIEQKTLQGEREFRRVRSELNQRTT